MAECTRAELTGAASNWSKDKTDPQASTGELALPSPRAKTEQQLPAMASPLCSLPPPPPSSGLPSECAGAALGTGGPGAQQAAAHLRGNTQQKSTTVSWCESKERFTLVLQVWGGRLCNPLKVRSQPSLQSRRAQTAQNNNLALSRRAGNYCCFDLWYDWTSV